MVQPLLFWNTQRHGSDGSAEDVGIESDETTTSRDPEPECVVTVLARTPGVHVDRLPRELVIDEILTRNPSATVEFLATFSEPRLRQYLARLRSTQSARGPGARWMRTGDSPAIVGHERLL